MKSSGWFFLLTLTPFGAWCKEVEADLIPANIYLELSATHKASISQNSDDALSQTAFDLYLSIFQKRFLWQRMQIGLKAFGVRSLMPFARGGRLGATHSGRFLIGLVAQYRTWELLKDEISPTVVENDKTDSSDKLDIFVDLTELRER